MMLNMNFNRALRQCAFVLIFCGSSVLSDKGNYEAPVQLFYYSDGTTNVYVHLRNIPTDNLYYYTVYRTDTGFGEGTLKENVTVHIEDDIKLPNNYTYYVSVSTKDHTLQCEPVAILNLEPCKTDCQYLPPTKWKTVDISVNLNYRCQTEHFSLKTKVTSPEHKDIDDGILRYNIGDNIKLLCSETTKNKRIHVQWHIVSYLYNVSLTWNNTTDILYDLHLEMNLKSFDNGTLVYCSAVTNDNKTVQTSSYIRLELIGQRDAIENMTAIYIKSNEVSIIDNCGKDDKFIKYIKNGTKFYCQNYTNYYENRAIIVRHTYNEFIYYVNEKGFWSANFGIILGVVLTIALISIAKVILILYRRRQRQDLEANVTYNLHENEYEEIPDDVSPPSLPPVNAPLRPVHGVRLNPETGVLTVHEDCFRRVSIKRENEL